MCEVNECGLAVVPKSWGLFQSAFTAPIGDISYTRHPTISYHHHRLVYVSAFALKAMHPQTPFAMQSLIMSPYSMNLTASYHSVSASASASLSVLVSASSIKCESESCTSPRHQILASWRQPTIDPSPKQSSCVMRIPSSVDIITI